MRDIQTDTTGTAVSCLYVPQHEGWVAQRAVEEEKETEVALLMHDCAVIYLRACSPVLRDRGV